MKKSILSHQIFNEFCLVIGISILIVILNSILYINKIDIKNICLIFLLSAMALTSVLFLLRNSGFKKKMYGIGITIFLSLAINTRYIWEIGEKKSFIFFLVFLILAAFLSSLILKVGSITKEKYRFTNEFKTEILLVVCCFLMYFLWSVIIPFNHAPDEAGRYLVPQYIFKYGLLPTGIEEEVRIPLWGFSYALTPILSYQVSAFLMKLTSFFSMNEHLLLLAARLASVLFSTGTVIFLLKISKKIFGNIFSYVFVVMVAFLPQFTFISSYVNNDSLAIFSSAIIFYGWILCLENHWDLKSGIILAIGIAICALSYMNAYGFILCSLVLYIGTIVIEPKKNMKSMLKVGLIVLLVAFILAGWWFIRMAVLYHGDIFGLHIKNELGEIYATTDLKPSNIITPFKNGMTIRDMLVFGFTSGSWWTNTYDSFIGRFGYMSIRLLPINYFFYSCIYLVGIIMLFLRPCICFSDSKLILTNMKNKLWYLTILIAIIIPICLSIWFSYKIDYQPQGRYVMPIILPLMYLLTKGLEMGKDLFVKKIRDYYNYFGLAIIIIYAFLMVFVFSNILLPAYY